MRYTNAISTIENYIERLIEGLAKYSKGKDAQQNWIDYQNGIISNLVEASNCLGNLALGDFWAEVEDQMASNAKRDPELSLHTIVVRVKPTGSHSSIIEFNSFER